MAHGIVNKFNRGEVDSSALARDDVTSIQNSAELVENFIPMRLGPMMYRPGTEYIGDLIDETYLVPFERSANERVLLEFSDANLRVWVADAVVTRTAVTTTITNETFDSDITGWTDDSGSGSSSSWRSGGYLKLVGNGTTSGAVYQTLTTDTGNEHGLRIKVAQGKVLLRIGISGSKSDGIASIQMGVGTYSLAFTPSGNITITLSSAEYYDCLVDSVEIEGAGIMSLDTDVATASLPYLRTAQSADVMFCAYDNGKQFKVERYGTRSWAVVEYRPDDGPFDAINTSGVTMSVNGTTGNFTLTASDDYFSSSHVGCLFKVLTIGQVQRKDATLVNDATGSIEITGIDTSRVFTIRIKGTWTGTVDLQRSADNSSWANVAGKSWTANTLETYDDGFDNAILYYRLIFSTASSGTAELSVSTRVGRTEGIGRVTSFTSKTAVKIEALAPFGHGDATLDWYKGSWNDIDGYPTAACFYEGRLWWAGKSRVWGSGSDAYYSFDRSIVGNSASIQKTVGFGPVDTVNWLAPSSRLIMGLTSEEIAIRSNALGEALTPTNCNLKSGSSQGSAEIAPLAADDAIYFVQQVANKIYTLDYNLGSDRHSAIDLNMFNGEICNAGIKRIAITHQPETRIWCVLDDGEMRVYTYDPTQEVSAWSRVTLADNVEDVVVTSGSLEDWVYVVVNRSGTRYLEKFGRYAQTRGSAISRHLDSHVLYTSPGTTITGLSHLEGETVTVWADAQDRGTFTVSSGQITVGSSWTNVVVGLAYTANYTSNKLSGYRARSVISERKRVYGTGLVLKNYWPGSLTIGPDTSSLQALPLIEGGNAVDLTDTLDEYDEFPFEFEGDTHADSRIYMRATGPVQVMALTYFIEDESADTPTAA